MIRREFVQRKLHLIAEDLEHLTRFRAETRDSLVAAPVKLAAVERLLERVVMRAIDVNEHLLAELATGESRSTRLTYRDTFLMLADLGVYTPAFANRIAASAGLRNILVHDYNDTDRTIVHASIATCLRDYRVYLEYVSRFVDQLATSGDQAGRGQE